MLLLLFSGRIGWRYMLAAPMAWIAMMVPAWLAGRSAVDLLAVYLRQGLFFDKLSMNAANLYYFAPESFYSRGVAVGVAITVVVSLIYAVVPAWRRTAMTPQFLLLAAMVSVAMAPFLLPKMHDRYFLPADLTSIALAAVVPRFWFIAVGFQVTSLLAYVPILAIPYNGGEYAALMPLAVVLNTLLVSCVGVVYWRVLKQLPSEEPADRVTGLAGFGVPQATTVAVLAALLAGSLWVASSGAAGAADPSALNWSIETHEGGSARVEYDSDSAGTEVIRVVILGLANAPQAWHVKLMQRPFRIEAGNEYRVTFRARSAADRPVSCAMGNNHEPWETLGLYQGLVVTATWTAFECPFTASADDSNARLFFDIGERVEWLELADVRVYDETEARVVAPPMTLGARLGRWLDRTSATE
jgi:hypothetical protein